MGDYGSLGRPGGEWIAHNITPLKSNLAPGREMPGMFPFHCHSRRLLTNGPSRMSPRPLVKRAHEQQLFHLRSL